MSCKFEFKNMIKRRLRITGKVQGVGFRYSLQEEAGRLGVNGWVRNRRDGSVEAVVQGPPATVDHMLDACRKGPPGSRVDRVEIIGEGVGAFDGFEVRPTT